MAGIVYSFPDGKIISGIDKEEESKSLKEWMKNNPEEVEQQLSQLSAISSVMQNAINDVIDYCNENNEDEHVINISKILGDHFSET